MIAKKGVGILGGNKRWLVAADGTQYYYAHVSAFGDGVNDGTVVEAGQVVGYVGSTGNAITTPAHVHFEIHPRGEQPSVPSRFWMQFAARTSAPLNTARPAPLTTTTLVGEVRAGVGVESDFAVADVLR